jgi:hypothetical protein
LNSKTIKGSCSRTAVDSSAGFIVNPPSPIRTTVGVSGRATAAPMAPASPSPIEPKPPIVVKYLVEGTLR